VPAPPETDVAKIRKYCQARVPAHLRHQVRVEAAVRGNSVTIFSCLPPWHPNLTEWSKVRVAQLRYTADTHNWSLYSEASVVPSGRLSYVFTRSGHPRMAGARQVDGRKVPISQREP
jgi:hypothetical protein